MEERYDKLLAEFSQEEQSLLITYLHELFEYKNMEDWENRSREKFNEVVARIKVFEERAKAKIEQRKTNPSCSFCNIKAHAVEKIFKHTDYLSICSNCVKKCYEQL